MFAATAKGDMLACYVVYKAKYVYSTWVEGGPKKSRYNATASGWFDILLGDNLSSHLSAEVVSLCNDNNIRFVFLPGNSTHLTQPLDIAFFRPLKAAWRKILLEWKRGPGMKEPSIPKCFSENICKINK
ncbi:hypothetical protein NQ317_015892 [Molorchus minor]|uniref:DDE-1 domain-containing protein n=1 Tax=Molorchus minor TaxID=1323400 RepID=A0ABQ9IXM3_9CUCU|nr:hypothetical protein NQ317_015892 [Molorchus minor]